MSHATDADYVLGTNDAEIERLGLQHRVWRAAVLECWSRAGITPGSRVLDAGAGPGYASADLAEIVGPAGQVIAVERSGRFVQAARDLCRVRGLENVQIFERDLMLEDVPAQNVDAVWCRWVASFVSSAPTLVAKLAAALRPGGVLVFHEYVDYRSWRLLPRGPALEAFVAEVMESWRASGGEPDVALELPALLAEHGLRVRSAVPKLFCAGPQSHAWQWPASFIDVNLQRLLELGRVDAAWADSVRREIAQAEANPHALMFTPMVLEILAERPD